MEITVVVQIKLILDGGKHEDRSRFEVSVCNNCVDLRIHRISKLLKEGVDGE
jgi:hypothetical protein